MSDEMTAAICTDGHGAAPQFNGSCGLYLFEILLFRGMTSSEAYAFY